MPEPRKLGLIAGNGNFPLLVLDAARAQGRDVVVAAIKEETWQEVEQRASAPSANGATARVHWLSLGDLSKLIDTFKKEGITEAVMAGQVKHKQIFSSIKPDWRLAKILLSLATRNTDSLIGAVAKELASEGITLVNSTQFLEPLLARPGVLTKRAPTGAELKDIAYGRTVGSHLAQYDIGQTVVIAAAACIAVEAMEGTDETILRAGNIITARNDAPNIQADASSAVHTALTIVKVAKPDQDMRFDVPIIGVRTIETMKQAGATCLAVDAGKCLMLDGDRIIHAADDFNITIVSE